LLVILLVMLVVWASMVSNAQDLPIPRPVLFFPLMIWAAFRGRLLGACLSGRCCACYCRCRFFPDLYLYAGSTELMTETALCLTFMWRPCWWQR
jgi:integral membrane sensor domain MASE1